MLQETSDILFCQDCVLMPAQQILELRGSLDKASNRFAPTRGGQLGRISGSLRSDPDTMKRIVRRRVSQPFHRLSKLAILPGSDVREGLVRFPDGRDVGFL